jgi:hypothetical protein
LAYIQPTLEYAAEDDAVSAIFQEAVAGITGLHPDLVRPLWQPQAPTQPEASIDWCGIGITAYTPVDYPQFHQQGLTSGMQSRLERVDVITMFFGPDSTGNASRWRDGLYLSENYDMLAAQGIKLRSADEIRHVPELINSQYIGRSDVSSSFMRMVNRTFSDNSIGQVSTTFITDEGLGCTITASE